MEPGFPRSVTVYGAGLMGSSFALALKQRDPNARIYGVDKPDVLDRARRLGIVEPAAPTDPSDLTVLATPVGEILELLENFEDLPLPPPYQEGVGLAPGLGAVPKSPSWQGGGRGRSSIILDLGSTKVDICAKAEQLKLPFIGGHPMTGSERSGPEAATAEIFKGARFFLCPISTTPEGALPKLEELIQSIGAVPQVIPADDHDRLVAKISHLPQILATLLAEHTIEHRDLAGPGLKSVTRLAASPFHVWRDILKTSGYLPQEIQAFIERLRFVLDALQSQGPDNLEEIEAIFERANRSTSGDPK